MSEKLVWRALREAWKGRGRICRVEVKSRSGFVDVLACHRGITYFIELKHVPHPFDPTDGKRALGGLQGPQAVELHRWAQSSAPAYLVVGWGNPVPQTFVGYHGGRVLALYEEASKRRGTTIDPPQPDFVMDGQFSWPVLFQTHAVLTSTGKAG